MQRKPFILLMLLTMSAASRAATDDFDSITGLSWVWILLALSLYVVIGVIFLLVRCAKPLSLRVQSKIKTYEAILKQAMAAAGARVTGGLAAEPTARRRSERPALEATAGAERIAGRWLPSPNRLDLNLADFEPRFLPRFLDIHILSNDHIAVRVDDVIAPEVGEPTMG